MTDRVFVRACVAVEWLLLAVFTGLLAVHTLPHAWRTLNTDFPNYYLAAQLAHEGYDMSQAYDWRWFQREKDHRKIDQPVVGLAPITPFSTLFLWPLTGLVPLQAKHIWLLFQIALLIPIALTLRSLTHQPMRRVALLTAACFPLHRNLLYGQFYILLLAMIVAACWAYHRRFFALAGMLVGIAAMTKVFPIIFLLYFLRKRDWRAAFATVVTLIAGCLISIAVFGWSMNREYFQVVLPWTLRGEVLPSYTLAGSSLAALLHRLFIYERQWNPHPWHNVPVVAAVLAPIFQAMLIAPIFLLIPGKREEISGSKRKTALEWTAVLCATLATSTSPASYNFVLLILPIVVLCTCLLDHRPVLMFIALFFYFGIGYPGWNTSSVDGVHALLHVPRLFFLIGLSALCSWVLAEGSFRLRLLQARNIAWGTGFVVLTALAVTAGVRHQSGLYDDDAYRLAMPKDALLAASPLSHARVVEAVAMMPNGYRVIPISPSDSKGVLQLERGPDQLSFAAASAGDWIEETADRSRIVATTGTDVFGVEGRAPITSRDGTLAAFIDDYRGSGRLIVRTALGGMASATPITPEGMNVHDAAAVDDGSFYVAAATDGVPSQIFLVQPSAERKPMGLGEARYPSVSPDGQWLAYSRFQSGAWNLWLFDRKTQRPHRLDDVPCNQVEPSWEPDSKTLLYASDCGRSLGFTAICRRKVIP